MFTQFLILRPGLFCSLGLLLIMLLLFGMWSVLVALLILLFWNSPKILLSFVLACLMILLV